MTMAIELRDLRKRYSSIQAVDGVSLSIRQGEIFGLVGPNGAGKTTTIEMMEGLRKPDSGELRVLGLDPQRDAMELKQRIGIQLQSTSVPDKAKVKEVLDVFSAFYRKRADLAGIVGFLGLEDRLGQYFKGLSGGWKQRVTLALALLNDPDIVFLDEPSMGLDPNARRDMWAIITKLRDQGRTIVVTTHYMEEAEMLCDRVGIMNRGKLVALDTPDRLVQTTQGGRRISFRAASGLAASCLRQLEGVVTCETSPEWLHLHSVDVDATLHELYLLAARSNVRINGLRLEEASLDDVYTKLTAKEPIAQ